MTSIVLVLCVTAPAAKSLAVAPVFADRSGEKRAALVKLHGGTEESEKAVDRGIAWLARQQKADGSWTFDGTAAKETAAATAMALLAFTGRGEHPVANATAYSAVVNKGVKHLISLQADDGSFRTARTMYAHALATLALVEVYGLSGEKTALTAANKAVKYCVAAQAKNGSWGYKAGAEGDTSILGWQIQALRAAEHCKEFKIPDELWTRTGKFLTSVSQDNSTYGYREGPGSPGTALTAIGLLSRTRTDRWTADEKSFITGVEGLFKRNPPAEARFNTYYLLYATQATFTHGGDAWAEPHAAGPAGEATKAGGCRSSDPRQLGHRQGDDRQPLRPPRNHQHGPTDAGDLLPLPAAEVMLPRPRPLVGDGCLPTSGGRSSCSLGHQRWPSMRPRPEIGDEEDFLKYPNDHHHQREAACARSADNR